MKGTNKLILDIVIGAVIPALILSYLSKPLGNIPAYVLAAFVPVTYVLIDTFVISRKFNVLTSYIALNAIISGILVFWFVDGVRYAFKDTLPLVVSTVIFLGSLLIGKPMMRFFADQIFTQILNPDTPHKTQMIQQLLGQPAVKSSYVISTLIVAAQNAVLGITNFLLNVNRVTASFNTEAFNLQVAQVNAITRVVFTVVGMLSMMLAIGLIYRAIFKVLPKEEGKSQFESELWDLIDKWQAQKA
jgi:hypothetical protein